MWDVFLLVTFGSNSLFITVELTFNYVLDRVNVTIKSNNTKIMFAKVVQRFESDFPTFFNFVSLDNVGIHPFWSSILILPWYVLKMFYFTLWNMNISYYICSHGHLYYWTAMSSFFFLTGGQHEAGIWDQNYTPGMDFCDHDFL